MIKADTAKFRLQTQKFVDKAKGNTRAFAVEFIQDLNEAIVRATPVVTGFLRASWHASINSMPVGAGSSPDPSGTTAVAMMNLETVNLQLGDVFYATNGAAYARRVEYGFVGTDSLGRHFNQPPHSFVRVVLDQADRIAAEAAARVAARS